MRRRARQNETTSTHTTPTTREFDAHRSIRDLQKRIRKLEGVVAELSAAREHDLDILPTAERARPGPKPLHGGMLISDRDQPVAMLESYWPEIEPFCSPRPNRKGLKKVLACIPAQVLERHAFAATYLMDHLSKLLDFLSTDRFRRDPRQIANAFAGFPKISTWTSSKRCQHSPCNNPIGHRAIQAYIRRKHPELHGRLMADYSLPNFAAAIRTYRTKDAKLNAFPAQYLYMSWKQCVADYQSLGLDSIEFGNHQSTHSD